QLAKLTESFQVIGPLEADRLLPAFKDSRDEAVGLKLIAALKDSPAMSGLRIDAIKAAIANFPPSVHEQAEQLYLLINVDSAKQRAKTFNVLLKSESADEIVLATGPKETARIARDDIEELRPSTISVMPSGLDQQLSTQDLADLIAFLKNAK